MPAAAGADDPHVTDPSGDVAAFGAPVPAGAEWADIEAAWFARDGDDLVLTIDVGDGAEAPPQGEIGVTFRAGDAWWIAGYTVVPGLYSGGFLSRADAGGDVPDSETPAGVDGTWEAGTVTARFPLADLETNATALEEPMGWSESRASNGRTYRLDETDTGKPFSWAAPAADPGTTTPLATQAAPGVGLPAVLALLALAAVAVTRRAAAPPARRP